MIIGTHISFADDEDLVTNYGQFPDEKELTIDAAKRCMVKRIMDDTGYPQDQVEKDMAAFQADCDARFPGMFKWYEETVDGIHQVVYETPEDKTVFKLA